MASAQKLIICSESITETLEKALKYLVVGKKAVLQNAGKFSVCLDILQS